MVVPTQTPPANSTDARWGILADLVKCRKDFGLNDRDLAVLRGLISCLPKTDASKTFVFASNVTLSNRTDGMHERTLRRHLTRLIAAGLIVRHSSPNGKRYVRRNHLGHAAHAFGFDLGPLFALHADIADRATMALATSDKIANLREKLSLLRHDLQMIDPDLAETIRKTLRRTNNLDTLEVIIASAKARMAEAAITLAPLGMSGNDSHFVRHNQTSIKDSKSTVDCSEKANEELQQVCSGRKSNLEHLPSLATVIEACPESCGYASDPIQTWPELIRFADMMAAMLQIDRQVMNVARRTLGPAAVAISVMCILQMGATVRSAGAYMRGLIKRAEMGGYSSHAMIKALLSPRLSAGAGR